MTNVLKISVRVDFSITPGPRFRKQGPFSGELFRESKLVPALRGAEKVIVDMDGTDGFGSSFIDEAFGGLVREHNFSKSDLKRKITVISEDDPLVKEDVYQAIEDASA